MNTPSESVPRTVKRIKAEAVNVLTEELSPNFGPAAPFEPAAGLPTLPALTLATVSQ